ncbi:hypothetical protein V6N13_129731 [Hibiscus sabdariffa]|uniref:Uncharacterized protein n=1 Tax=Hibiscus sabdariffa TaxID=183260 RepID=A0ABR2SM42_9ROSI
MRAVCKAWAVPNRHIPAVAIDKLPWALKESSWVDDDCRLLHSLIFPRALGLCEEVEEACVVSWAHFFRCSCSGRSVLANTVVSCGPDSPSVRCYGSTCTCVSGTNKESLLYRKCVEATKCAMTWIQLPSAGIWTADDLIKAV